MLFMGTSERDRRPGVMRGLAVVSVVSLVTLMTAFDYQPAGLLQIDEHSSAPPEPPGAVDLEPIAPEESFAAPVDLIVRPDDDRLIVVELMGTIVAVDTEQGIDSDRFRTTLLDVGDLTLVEGERGLLGAAFHPSDPLLYVHHSNLDGDSVIAEYRVDADTGIADPDTRRELLIVTQPHPNHNGGQVAFGPDGHLYLGFGDGGSTGDPDRMALDLGTPLGKILRIDPTPTQDRPFTVPEDNPYVDVDGADPTIWSIGLRNPWKFSFDPATGGLWIADVGQDRWEEIDAVLPTVADGLVVGSGRGLSFGWSAFEGDAPFNTDQIDRDHGADDHVDPYFTYERVEGRCSISGGAVYRGEALPALEGYYVFGDYCSGEILAIDSAATDEEVADGLEVAALGRLDALVAITTGADGELYAISVTGTVSRLS